MLVPSLLSVISSLLFTAAGGAISSPIPKVWLPVLPLLFTFFGTAAAEFGIMSESTADLVGGLVVMIIPGAILGYGAATIDWQEGWRKLNHIDRVTLETALSIYALAIVLGVWLVLSKRRRSRPAPQS